jgi:hypothetical protein
MAVLSFLLAVLLVFMWLSRIVSALGGEFQGVLHGQTTFVVQAFDLGPIVPLALFTSVTAWRGSALGYLLCSTVVVKACGHVRYAAGGVGLLGHAGGRAAGHLCHCGRCYSPVGFCTAPTGPLAGETG